MESFFEHREKSKDGENFTVESKILYKVTDIISHFSMWVR